MIDLNRTDGVAPIEDFSQCHAGIVSHLEQLDELAPLLEPAMRARRLAAEALRFFRGALFEHHTDEERELFPSVLAHAGKGEERERVQGLVDRLVREHRHLESLWSKLEPELQAVATGGQAEVEVSVMRQLVTHYQAHAEFEEQHFLPLARDILGREGEHLAALGLRLHMRHTPLQQTPF